MPEPISTTATVDPNPAPAADASAAQSPEDLLGLEPEAYAAPVADATAGEAAAGESGEAADGAPAAEAAPQEDEIPEGAAMPDGLKKAIQASPESRPEIQRLWGILSAYREHFGTVREARELREVFPGGSQDAKIAATKAAEMQRSDQLFLSGNPESQRELASNMLQMNPAAFGSLFDVAANLLKEKHPDIYSNFVGAATVQSLQGDKVHEELGLIAQELQGITKEQFKTLPESVQNLLFYANRLVGWGKEKGLFGEKKPLGTKPEPSAREKQLAQENETLLKSQWTSFSQSVNSVVEPAINSAIEKLIDPVLKALPPHARTGAKETLLKNINQGIKARLKTDTYYADEKNKILAANKYMPGGKDETVKLLTGRALLHLKPVAKAEIAKWTPQAVANGNAVADKTAAAARRTEITGGGLGQRKPTLSQKDANGMSNEDILSWALSRGR